MYFAYMLRCSDGTLYTGITTDPDRRVREHNHPTLGAKYTRSRRPVTLVYRKGCPDRSEALKEESRMKKLPRKRKLEMIRESGEGGPSAQIAGDTTRTILL